MKGLPLTAFLLTAILTACKPDAAAPSSVTNPEGVSPARSSPTPTDVPAPVAPQGQDGIWIARKVLASLPVGGAGWAAIERQSSPACGPVDLTNQDSGANVCVFAKALMAARTGAPATRAQVIAALRELVNAPGYRGRALSLGRELAAYVIAADLIDLARTEPALDQSFRNVISGLLTTNTSEGPANLVECHELRPNNWGTNCGASRAAVLAYLGDATGLARVAQVFRGWLGDRGAYAGFRFGELWWQCDPAAPVAINPPGCIRDGHSLDGVLADDQRRAGPFGWPPARENYVYEALQGAIVQAVILQEAGHAAFDWENRAILRAFKWLYTQANYPAGGDDAWLVPVINHYYRTSYAPAEVGRPGKVMAWTEWTHNR
jgi:hypothetical protein